MTILQAMKDRALFGRWFAGSSWNRHRVFLKALFGIPMTASELAIFTEHTGRTAAPTEGVKRATLIAGRRSGKTILAAVLAVFVAAFTDWRKRLAPGETAVVMILAADRKQARVAFRYVRAFINETPMLKAMVSNDMKESIELNNGATIEIHTASYRSVRGYTCVAVIADEVAFWATDSESERSDEATIAALEPTLATTGGLLLAISSPYARRGYLWEQWRRFYGKDDPQRLVWVGPSSSMNPTLDAQVVADAYEADEAIARAEYGAEFRSDVESFVSREAVAACVIDGRLELPPVAGVRYVAFVDPSGGSQDSMTLAIAHAEESRVVLDCVRERQPPFSPEAVVGEYATLLKSYCLTEVTGDAYSGAWVREAFEKLGITYRVSAQPKSVIYGETLPLLNAGRNRLELLDLPRLVAQLVALERRTSRGGRDSIDHPPRAHDDLINAASGAAVLARRLIDEPVDIIIPELRKSDTLYSGWLGDFRPGEWNL